MCCESLTKRQPHLLANDRVGWGNNFWTIRANFEVQIESKKSRKKLKSEIKFP